VIVSVLKEFTLVKGIIYFLKRNEFSLEINRSYEHEDVQSFKTCLPYMNYEWEFMPTSNGETYNFDYDKRHGVTLEFIQLDKIVERQRSRRTPTVASLK
jgi:hypothetical protein